MTFWETKIVPVVLVIFCSIWLKSMATVGYMPNMGQMPTVIVEEIDAIVDVIRPSAAQKCITPNNTIGQCVHLVRCPLPEFKLDKLRFMDYFCIIDRVYVGVCCPNSFLYAGRPGPESGGNAAGYLPAIGNDLSPAADEDDTPTVQLDSTGNATGEAKKIMFSDRKGCGVNQNAYFTRIAGGKPADPKQWPWMVSLIRDREHICGGCLITDKHVLTAAHCLPGTTWRRIIVRLGEHDLIRPEETRTQDFRIAQAIIHKDYSSVVYENDIAILKLDRPVVFNTYAWPVCLPSPDSDFVDEEAIVIGWGAKEYGGPFSNLLMEVPVPVWNNTNCEDQYVQQIWETNICAGGEFGKDSCQGDSGGPLLHRLPNRRWVIIGIVSWGISCGESRPAVYTRVNKYLNWIVQNTLF